MSTGYSNPRTVRQSHECKFNLEPDKMASHSSYVLISFLQSKLWKPSERLAINWKGIETVAGNNHIAHNTVRVTGLK